jgi:predicted RNA binding protein YcfA (HicA-like mRNA interferase family)
MPSEVRFAIVRDMLESCGWMLTRVKGSHHTFTKRGQRPVVIPVHRNRVKPVYVQEVKKICSEEKEAGNADRPPL